MYYIANDIEKLLTPFKMVKYIITSLLPHYQLEDFYELDSIVRRTFSQTIHLDSW